ncbi:MAG: hypothetical protein AB7T06_08645 [Kofleriaceae bacterium]
MKRFTLGVIVAAASQMAATGGDGCGPDPVLRDPGFDLWCGDTLCTWKVVAGEIKKAPTWHEGDAGVEFLGAESAIEQIAPVDSTDTRCIKFDLVANVDDKAEVKLEIDVQADGSVDLEERIPTSKWKPLTYNIRLDGNYRGVRFLLSKRGAGKATLAQIAAYTTAAADCDGFEPVPVAPAPNGAWCTTDADCLSQLCRTVPDDTTFFGTARACVGCETGTCDAGSVCGIFEPSSFVRSIVPACVPEASKQIGERCSVGTECGSGICNGDVCSTCDATNACANGGTCGLAYVNGPTMCTGGARGEPCAIDDDCTSGRCEGAQRKQCADGRGCASPESCPVEGDGTLEPGACTLVGVLGGTCF